MTAPVSSDLAWLRDLERAHAAIGDSPAFRVVGYVQDDENPEWVLARWDDGGTSVFAECYGADAAALIVAAVNALPTLTAAIRTEARPCWCIACEHLAVRARTEGGDPLAIFARRFIVCPDCGNKRCPKATHHDHECTGSNEPGQPGSAYTQTVSPPASVEELRSRILTQPAPGPP